MFNRVNIISLISLGILLLSTTAVVTSQSDIHYGMILSFGKGQCSNVELSSMLEVRGDEALFTYKSRQLHGGVDFVKKELKGGFSKVFLDTIGLKVFTDKNNSRIVSRDMIGKDIFIVHDHIEPIQWQIKSTSKKIDNYTCLMAVAEFRGRIYTAWFTPDIPVSFGPWKLHGLPGLIVEVSDQSKEVCFYLKSIKGENHSNQVAAPTDGTLVNFNEFMSKYLLHTQKEEENGRLMAEQLGIEGFQPIDFHTIIEIPSAH